MKSYKISIIKSIWYTGWGFHAEAKSIHRKCNKNILWLNEVSFEYDENLSKNRGKPAKKPAIFWKHYRNQENSGKTDNYDQLRGKYKRTFSSNIFNQGALIIAW